MISFTLWNVLKYTYNIQTVVVGFFFFTFITIYIYKLMLLVEGLHGWFFFLLQIILIYQRHILGNFTDSV